MPSYIVGTADEVPPGERKIVEVAGRSIGIFNVAGRYYAIRNRCPHQGGPLCLGVQTGMVEAGGPGQYHYARRGEFLRCPWHGWEFEIATGQSWFDPAHTRVRSYAVSVAEAKDVPNARALPDGVDERIAASMQGRDVPGEHEDTGLAEAGPSRLAAIGGRQPGPYQAETYRIHREERYLVLTIT
jgi:nitrite reductase/ring-hydroxylating ferredoxin subunit